MMKKTIIVGIILCLALAGGFIIYRGITNRASIREIAIDAAVSEYGISAGTVHDVDVDSENYGGKKCYEVSFECMGTDGHEIEVEVFIAKDTKEVLSITQEND